MKRLAALILCSSVLLLADVANMSGTWKLNSKRSEWGKKQAPDNVVITIEHKEPSFKYSGSAQPYQSAPSKFSFEGSIDGKDYTAKDDEGDRRVRFSRKSDSVVESIQWSHDGKEEQTTTTTISPDGKTLTRKLRTRSPAGEMITWTEVYEKQQ
ncbi:MAG TPA: hypothetical protein VEQ63_11015 [Bryobacteraceae bacterium]|nr:hypothetical protein [Bryobacteraceae bacterium]